LGGCAASTPKDAVSNSDLRASLTPLQRLSVAHEAFLQSLLLEDQGQPQYELEALLTALYYDDSNRWLLVHTAQRLRDLHRSREALPLMHKALAMSDGSAQDWELLAGLWLDLGKSDSARSSLDMALKLDPSSRPSMVGLAVLAEREGRLKDAASQYAQLALVAENPAVFSQKAYQIWGRAGLRDSILVLAKGLWERNRSARDGSIAAELLARQGSQAWRAILDSLPDSQDGQEQPRDSVQPELQRIRCLWLSGEPDSARAAVLQYLRTTTPEADLPLVGTLQFEGDSGAALQGMLMALGPSDPAFRIPLVLGTIQMSRGHKDSAALWFDQALSRDSSQSSTWMRRCALELNDEAPMPMVRLSRLFVAHCPKDPQARWLAAQSLEKLAEARLRSHPWETVPPDSEPEATQLRLEALAHLEAVQTLDSSIATAQFEEAALLERLGRTRASDSLLNLVIAQDSSNHTAMNYLGFVLADRNEHLDLAERLLDKALALSPGNGAYLDSRGWLRYRQGRYEQALADINASMSAERSDEVILEHRAYILEALGRTADAQRDWTLLLERVPGYRPAQQALQRLRNAPRSPAP
jgi:Tfp pilus assembly protein PilF